MASALVVEADSSVSDRVRSTLEAQGHQVTTARTAADGMHSLRTAVYDLVLTGLTLKDRSGIDFLTEILGEWPELPVVVIATHATIEEGMTALRAGAVDCLTKDVDADEIAFVVRKAVARTRSAGPEARPVRDFNLVGNAPSMLEMRQKLTRLANSNATVLIRGESGTGKELVAQALHAASPRHAQPFVKIDCTSLPENLLESELFGYEKGAFTGAASRKPGRVELAEGGTLFLDEIGELPLTMQAKLLRLLQDRQFERLGARQSLRVDVRFVCATHRDLETLTANKEFREDLFYRLNVAPLWLPPLRSRRDDIEMLVTHFLARGARENAAAAARMSPEGLKLLRSQRWPGNVRQLENFVERLALLSEGPVIQATDVQRELTYRPQFETQSTGLTQSSAPEERASAVDAVGSLEDAARAAERRLIETVLTRAAGNRTVAARLLGISRATLYNKLRELGIAAREERLD